jgi:serine/threonine protein kinase
MALLGGMATSATSSALGSSISQSKPRLTYSSVIHLLVEQLTRRSPFLRSSDYDGDQDIAPLCRDEIRTGQLLGSGNFSNVFEVVSLDLREQQGDGRTLKNVTGADGENEDSPCYGSIERLPRSKVASTEHRDETAGDQLRSNLRGTHEQLCLKCLKPELLEGDNPKAFLDAATDLVIEAKYMSKLSHKNILKVRGLAEGWEAAFSNGEYDSFFILIDRLDETLNQRVKKWRRGELTEENTIERKLPLMRQLASALAYLHDRRILFRDCKPQNIGLIMEQDSGLSIKLFDFGFCRELPALMQARDDVEDRVSSSVTSLKSGEQVFLMSGKGTR